MRKILVVVGSGLRNANTDRLADAFVRGAQDAGHEVKKFFLTTITFTDAAAAARARLRGRAV